MRDYNTIPFNPSKREQTLSKKPPSESPTEATTNTPTPSSSLAPSDALRVRRQGTDATIQHLRSQLDEYMKRESDASTQVSKLQAEKLELRSQIRQLERRQAQAPATQAGNADDLQNQLSQALTQLRTADMVRKELEDTLEAEMYTWDLRVKDQERTILQMQQEYNALQDELEQMRERYRREEQGWRQDVQAAKQQAASVQQASRTLQSHDQSDAAEMKDRIIILERERSELQGCLDEALKELEAVDQELQGDDMAQLRDENHQLREQLAAHNADLTEPLQALYRMLLERDDFQEFAVHKPPTQPRDILRAMETHLQNNQELAATNGGDVLSLQQQIQELEGQISVYKGDLQAREESSAELRSSLKEAVALLKPLQEAVGKAEREKEELQDELESLRASPGHGDGDRELRRQLDVKDDELETVKERLEKTEIELSRIRIQAASKFVSPQRDRDSSMRTREELSAKRAQERTIQAMLATAQNRFRDLEGRNQEAEALNSELRSRLDSAHQQVQLSTSHESSDAAHQLQRELESRDIALQEMGNDLKLLQSELEARNKELEQLKYRSSDEAMATKLKALQTRSEQLEWKLRATKKEVNNRKENERTLNKSLKEALDLLRPLQSHLEVAEQEKQQLQHQVRQLRLSTGDDVSTRSRNVPDQVDARMMQHLRDTVKQLENENTQLHNALEEMSSSFNISHLSGISNFSHKEEARLREEIVETKSRYEVTQKRLQEASHENKQLVDTLQWKEKRERAMENELKALQDKLRLVSSNGSVGSQDRPPSRQQQLYEHQRQQGQLSGRTTPPMQNGTRSNYRLS